VTSALHAQANKTTTSGYADIVNIIIQCRFDVSIDKIKFGFIKKNCRLDYPFFG